MKRVGAASLALLIAGLALWGLWTQFGGTSWASVRAAVRAQPASHLFGAASLTALSFLCLAVYDLLGARVVAGKRISTGVALTAGATANAVSNTLGFHALTGSVVRARIYLRQGLTGAEVARIVSLSWLALGLGFLTMLAGAELMQGLHAGRSLLTGLGVALALIGLVCWLAGGPRQLNLFSFHQPLPSARIALMLMGTGAIESAAAIGALYVLLPADLAPPFTWFAVGCIAAVALGLLAHAPGGIGVFEAGITALLSGAGRADLLAALLLYRLIYNVAPFLLSVVALAWLSRRQQRAQLDGG